MKAMIPSRPMTKAERLMFDQQVANQGSPRRPDPPRDVFVQSGSRKVLLTWKLPPHSDDIRRWRIYRDTEKNLVMEVADRGTRQMYLDVSAGTTPPTYNFFVSSVNAAGVESVKVQVQGKATAETGAPSDPPPPPGYTNESSGGGDKTFNPKGASTF